MRISPMRFLAATIGDGTGHPRSEAKSAQGLPTGWGRRPGDVAGPESVLRFAAFDAPVPAMREPL